MNDLIFLVQPIAAIGYSMLYLVFGGGLIGAGIIFLLAKLLGR